MENGILIAMKTTIDRLGRVVVPKAIRDKLNLKGGESLEVEERDGVVEMRPAASVVRVVQTPQGPVADPLEEVAPLTDDMVRDTLERVRR
jgi:AbrB family looped-hinge helix DNA binding protein